MCVRECVCAHHIRVCHVCRATPVDATLCPCVRAVLTAPRRAMAFWSLRATWLRRAAHAVPCRADTLHHAVLSTLCCALPCRAEHTVLCLAVLIMLCLALLSTPCHAVLTRYTVPC